jgi:hypothetical protein
MLQAICPLALRWLGRGRAWIVLRSCSGLVLFRVLFSYKFTAFCITVVGDCVFWWFGHAAVLLLKNNRIDSKGKISLIYYIQYGSSQFRLIVVCNFVRCNQNYVELTPLEWLFFCQIAFRCRHLFYHSATPHHTSRPRRHCATHFARCQQTPGHCTSAMPEFSRQAICTPPSANLKIHLKRYYISLKQLID